MPRWTPCKRRNLIRKLRHLGFEGPFSGSRHQFLIYRHHRLAIPTNAEYSVPQLRMLIREVELIIERELSVEIWDKL